MGFLSAFLAFAATQAEAHPEVLKTLMTGIGAAISAHEQHPTPASIPALTELRAGIAAAASSAVTSLIAKQGLGSTVTTMPSLASVPATPTPAPASETAADAPRMA